MRRSSSLDFQNSAGSWMSLREDEESPPAQETDGLPSTGSRQNLLSQNIPGKRSSVSFPDSSADHFSGKRGSSRTQKKQSRVGKKKARRLRSRIYDDPAVVAGYASVPLLDLDRLPRGGISLETQAVGRIQFGIPPETIKDSMRLGFGVPSVYIVPVERFCREMGPALGINLAEFEFPAYFNYFIRLKRCTLVVDSYDAESNIRKVFGETLLGPATFRNHSNIKQNEDEDFDPSFPKEARPNFYKEFYHFRTAEEASNYQELKIDMLLDFCHFNKGSEQSRRGNRLAHDKLGVPPSPSSDYRGEDNEDVAKRRRRRTRLFSVGDERRNPVHDLTIVERDRETALTQLEEEDGSFAGLSDVEEEDDSESHQQSGSLRRTRSDPDLKRLSLDSTTHSIPASPNHDTSPAPSEQMDFAKRGSVDSTTSFMSRGGRSRGGMSWADGASFMLASDDEDDPTRNTWMYSQAKWLGEVATVYPATATDEQKKSNQTPRVEIFKMTGGTEYIVHDVDEHNIIVGKARFSGTVRVPDEIAVEGFLTTADGALAAAEKFGSATCNSDDKSDTEDENDNDILVDEGDTGEHGIERDFQFSIRRPDIPKTFHPPSFGVTVLGNSHGFDKNGSVSGYVLWVNGRGVMIDPPPYASATLEREGIRPQMIVAIIITHCHADHDAGTFQKVMTGLRVAIITTPTIYKSFIRKYAALSGLNPTLLRHSHRHRAAIVGQPLRFQGATFNFTYTLHTIPCIGFKVELRGRSMVFTGDHLNSPPVIEKLEKTGVLTKERADDLRHLPLQECDALLHEAGAPPIHTPLAVLKALPAPVKQRLYVVHTSALPDDCGLRVAPTGTAGTIRLDQPYKTDNPTTSRAPRCITNGINKHHSAKRKSQKITRVAEEGLMSVTSEDDAYLSTARSTQNDGSNGGIDVASLDDGGYPNLTVTGDFVAPNISTLMKHNHGETGSSKLPPLVFLRPTCVSDAWFILNLLSAVPFLSSLSYANTMEVLEIAQVEMYCQHEIVIPADRRSEILCVVWEGTCVECDPAVQRGSESDGSYSISNDRAQTSDELDSENVHFSDSGDGLLRRFNPTVWYAGDWTGPVALQPETERSTEVSRGGIQKDVRASSPEGVKVIVLKLKDLYKILQRGSKLFRNYLALKEKRAAEEAAMKTYMMRNEAALQTGLEDQVPNHWNAFDGVLDVIKCNSALGKLTAQQKRHLESLAEGPRLFEAGQHLWQVGDNVDFAFLIVTGTAVFASRHEEQRIMNRRATTGFMFPTASDGKRPKRVGVQRIQEDKQLFNVSPSSEYARLEVGLQLRQEEMELDVFDSSSNLLPKEQRMRNARDRFANKVLARLYSRRAYTAGLVFSRGHWLSDTSRMVSGSLAHINYVNRREDKKARSSQSSAGDHHCHTSNMVAGPGGCAVMVFPRSSLIQFLEGHPGVLLSLLGTQVVV